MDMDEFRVVLGSAGVDVWTFIDTAIAVASVDYRDEMKGHRHRIVELLYASSAPRCRNCDGGGDAKAASSVQNQAAHALQNHNGKLCSSPSTPQSFDGEEEEEEEEEEEDDDDDDGGGGGGGGDVRDRGEGRRLESPMDDEQTRILTIKEHLEDPHQTEESLVGLLQTLADMDITFKALKETDIGRHVNRLRKHSSNDVRRLVKQLVRKWKDLVDEWVRLNTSGDHLVAPSIIADGDSPLQKLPHNGHHQVPDFAYSPNPHNGSSGSEKNNEDTEAKRKILPPREAQAPAKPVQTAPSLARVPPHKKQREQRGEEIDMERLAWARKRLQQNYQEAENAKKQRTIRVMEIHDIPKPKKNNGFFAKSRGGRHW